MATRVEQRANGKSSAAASNSAASKDVKAAPTKKKGGKVDRSTDFFTAFNICAIFGTSLYYASTKAPNVNDGKMRYLEGPFYDFMVSPQAFLGMPALYLVIMWVAARFMANRPPTNWFKDNVQPVYNVVQIVLCSYMVWGLWPKNWLNPFSLNSQPDASTEWFVFVHLLSKSLDLCDTVFMVARKSYRQFSFLHLFHHSTISIIWAFLLSRGWGSGTAAYGAFINSAVHVALYSYYFLTTMGVQIKNKHYLTRFQLAQFASCVLHAVLVMVVEEVYPKDLATMQIAYHFVMMYLFGVRLAWAPVWCSGPIPGLDDDVAAAPTESKKKTKSI